MSICSEHLTDLRKSGLTDATIKEAGIYSVCPENIRKKLGFSLPQIESILAFPYGDGFERFKNFPSFKDKDGHTVKYLQRKGTPARLYIPPQTQKVLKAPNIPLAIAEGEKKVLRLVQEDIPAIGIGGIWSWSQNRHATPDFGKIIWQGRTIHFFPDSDVWQRQDLLKAVFALSKELEKRGANVVIYKIPASSETKVGVDDYLQQGHGIAELRALPTTTIEGPEFDGMEGWHTKRELEKTPLNMLNTLNMHPWPTLKSEALYGLAGDIVRAIEPHTEADPVALLVNVLACFGNIVSDKPHFVAEADRHAMRLNAVFVGETSKGRKGSGWGRIRSLFKGITNDDEWEAEHILSGLSSGEGLIWAVRDAIEKTEPIREKKRITGYQTIVTDQGVEDKRLLVLESEFSSVLRVLSRDGNTLSAIIRQAWDTGDLRTLTKNSPAKATGAHISILGHITKEELLRYLDNTEAGNGFGNRFLWLCVRRSKILPEGGRNIDLNPLARRLSQVIEFARTVAEVKRDNEAREVWHKVYPTLSEGKPGLFGALTSRGEAQVMRLACIYALLDCSQPIRREHLLAALALWDYCEKSVKYIFGNATGDTVADRIVEALSHKPEGLSRSDIFKGLFGCHVSSERIDRAVAQLLSRRLVKLDKRDTGGRPIETILMA